MVTKNKRLRDRAIYVYLPTVRMADEWKKMADKSSISISKFVIEHVENSLKQEEENKYRRANTAKCFHKYVKHCLSRSVNCQSCSCDYAGIIGNADI